MVFPFIILIIIRWKQYVRLLFVIIVLSRDLFIALTFLPAFDLVNNSTVECTESIILDMNRISCRSKHYHYWKQKFVSMGMFTLWHTFWLYYSIFDISDLDYHVYLITQKSPCSIDPDLYISGPIKTLVQTILNWKQPVDKTLVL